MNKDFLNQMKETLISQRDEIVSKCRSQEDIDAEGDAVDEIQANLIASISTALFERDQLKLQQIENALSKILNDKYGSCEECGDEIAERRLMANPHFLTCISCAEEQEIQNRNRRKS